MFRRVSAHNLQNRYFMNGGLFMAIFCPSLTTLAQPPFISSKMYNSRTRLCANSSQSISSQTMDDDPVSLSKLSPKPEHRPITSPEETAYTHCYSCRTASWKMLMVEWKWILFYWVLGTAASVIIFCLLQSYRNRPVSDWQFSSFSMPSVIVGLSQVALSALMQSISSCLEQMKWIWFQHSRRAQDLKQIDQVTRGFSGSVVLLRKSFSRGYHRSV